MRESVAGEFTPWDTNSCSDLLNETAIRHYFTPRPYEVPQKNAWLWRYMDFTKYVSLLTSQALYFARADTFDDQFEGAKGVAKNKSRWDEHYLEFLRYALNTLPEGVGFNLSEDEVERESQRLLGELEESGKNLRSRVYISCWHENEFESEAMWRLYSSYIDNAIAVRTTFERLKNSLDSNSTITIGRVAYINYSKEFADVNGAFWRKRRSFEHEREVRALVHDFELDAPGKLISCDLDKLIEEIYVSPAAPSWFVEVVNSVNSKYGVGVSVSSSRLNDEPFF